MFVDKKLPFLAASSDGLIGKNSIVEIKCPASINDFILQDAYENKKLNFMSLIGGELKLKTSHNYYFHLQGQLHITKRIYCYLVVWTLKGITVLNYNFRAYITV